MGVTTLLGCGADTPGAGSQALTAAGASVPVPVARPTGPVAVPAAQATTLWYPAPADEPLIIQEGLPIGNGRLGALVGGAPDNDFVYLSDGSLWIGDANDALGDDGQYSYEGTHFGSFQKLAHVRIAMPGHTLSAITEFRRGLDLSNGIVTMTYTRKQTQYRREAYASHPDDVVIMRLVATGPDRLTGSVTVQGTRGETTAGYPATLTVGIDSMLGNGLKYAAVVTA
ncbi:MAG TPA: glycoside hydrolase N-terminal domain-containing protein, partial [Polyangiaceae bacterium]|nr:glycoside hydrolase N-terminal domain-containing protein [Polyangiaceae bacterium]